MVHYSKSCPPSVNPGAQAESGPAEIQLTFDLSKLSLSEQNHFINAMDAAGFGNPSTGVFLTTSPPVLCKPLSRATFTFTTSDVTTLERSIGKALEIARQHRVRFSGATFPNNVVVSKGVPMIPAPRIAVMAGQELLAEVGSLDEALLLLDSLNVGCDCCCWSGWCLLALRTSDGMVLRIRREEVPALEGVQS